MHEVLVNRLGGLSLPRKSVVRLTDRPDMTLDVYCGRKTTMQQQHLKIINFLFGTNGKFIIFRCPNTSALYSTMHGYDRKNRICLNLEMLGLINKTVL